MHNLSLAQLYGTGHGDPDIALGEPEHLLGLGAAERSHVVALTKVLAARRRQNLHGLDEVGPLVSQPIKWVDRILGQGDLYVVRRKAPALGLTQHLNQLQALTCQALQDGIADIADLVAGLARLLQGFRDIRQVFPNFSPISFSEL